MDPELLARYILNYTQGWLNIYGYRGDSDKDGRLSFEEFEPMWPGHCPDLIRQKFNEIDTDGNGYISLDELANAIKDEWETKPCKPPVNHFNWCSLQIQ